MWPRREKKYSELRCLSPLSDQYAGDHHANTNVNNGNYNWQDSLFLFVAIFLFFWLLSVWQDDTDTEEEGGAWIKNNNDDDSNTLHSSHRHSLMLHFLKGTNLGERSVVLPK